MLSKILNWLFTNLNSDNTISYYQCRYYNSYNVQLNLNNVIETFESEEDCLEYIELLLKEYPNYKYIGRIEHPGVYFRQQGFNSF